MIDKFNTLCRVKELREEQRSRAVQAKRREVESARARAESARDAADRSRATLAARESKIFDEVIREVVALREIEKVKNRVLELGNRHQRLVDDRDRALHVLKERSEELQKLRNDHREALIERDKYQMTKRELEAEARVRAEAAEEAELEDMPTNRTLMAT